MSLTDSRSCAHNHPRGEERSTLEYRASMGAPGIGDSYECTVCGDSLVIVGYDVYDPKEMDFSEGVPWEMSPEDCI